MRTEYLSLHICSSRLTHPEFQRSSVVPSRSGLIEFEYPALLLVGPGNSLYLSRRLICSCDSPRVGPNAKKCSIRAIRPTARIRINGPPTGPAAAPRTSIMGPLKCRPLPVRPTINKARYRHLCFRTEALHHQFGESLSQTRRLSHPARFRFCWRPPMAGRCLLNGWIILFESRPANEKTLPLR